MTSPYGALSDELEGLIERVGKATGPDRQIDGMIYARFGGDGLRKIDQAIEIAAGRFPAYTASLDAALALVERLHPGWDYGLDRDEGEFYATIAAAGAAMSTGYQAQAASMPLAIILAALRSLQTGAEE